MRLDLQVQTPGILLPAYTQPQDSVFSSLSPFSQGLVPRGTTVQERRPSYNELSAKE
jgi:hypothetical protein